MDKKRICALICVISMVGLIASSVVILGLNGLEIIRDVEIRNPDGSTGTVFVVFRPGVSRFNEDIINDFIRGLVESDWRVEVTTCSAQTPTNVTAYDLVVMGSPVNGGKPHQSMLDYLARANLAGKPVVLILTSGGEDGPGMSYFENATIDANGVVLSEFQFILLEASAGDSAYTAGTQVTLEP
jgi:hypothetical protein